MTVRIKRVQLEKKFVIVGRTETTKYRHVSVREDGGQLEDRYVTIVEMEANWRIDYYACGIIRGCTVEEVGGQLLDSKVQLDRLETNLRKAMHSCRDWRPPGE